MADTFDSRLKLRLQESGANSGQWGTLLNQTITNIASVFGFGTHQLTSDADATLTLSDDGASLDALKSSYLKITSSVSLTATRTLTFAPNTLNQVKYIENATSGSQSITISQGSGSSVTIESGSTKIVYFTGSGASAAVVDALANIDQGTAEFDTIRVSTIKANDGTASSTIADSTGIMTIASAVLTTADINGGTIDNTVIGGSTAAAGTFTNVSATNVSLPDDGVLSLGSSDEFTLKHHNSGYSHLINTTGTLFIDSDSVTFRDDDGSPTNVLINQSGIDVTGAGIFSGDLAIGNDTSTSTVSKTFTTGHASANRGKNVQFGMSDSTFAGMQIVNAAAANTSFNAQSINFITHEGGVSVGTRMTIDSSGKVGIGTSDPKSTLEVKGTFGAPATSGFAAGFIQRFSQTSGVGSLDVGFGDPYSWLQSRASNNYATNFALALNPNGGKVGIGTGSPGDLLSIKGSGNTAVSINTGNNSGDNSQLKFGDSADDDVGQINYDHGTNAMQFRTNGAANTLILDNGGKVGIKTSPINSALYVGYGGGFAGQLLVEGGTGSAYVGIGHGTDSPALHWQTGDFRFATSTASDLTGFSEKMRIRNDGNVGIGSSGMPVFSSYVQLSLGPMAHFMAEHTSGTSRSLHISQNAHLDADGSWETMETDEASNYYQTNGTHNFRVASSTSAGTDISWITALQLTSAGQLVLPVVKGDTTSDAANLNIRTSDGLVRRSTSSRRYKNTITDATHGLTELLSLRPVTYKGNNDGDRLFGGLIAEEVHDAGLTEFVQYNSDDEPDALAYGHMVSLCIKAIQEQQTLIESLTDRIAALENN